MKNKLILSLVVGLVVATLPVPALAWGSATHLYLSEKLGNKDGVTDQQEMYGATLVDVFNLMFGHPYQPYLWNETHYGFMKLVEAAEPEEMALAYGFASHNEAWGADHTAHIDALTIEGEGGYVIIKSQELAPILAPEIRASLEQLVFIVYEMVPPYPADIELLIQQAVQEMSFMLADNGVESAVDYLVGQNEDKKVGDRMFGSAQDRDSFVPLLLVEAYAEGLASQPGMTYETASNLIMATEAAFQTQMMSYGLALAQEDPGDIKEAMAEQGAVLAIMIIEAEYGITVPLALYPLIFQEVKNLMIFTLNQAIEVVEDDYVEELEATQKYIKKQLNAHKIKTYRK
ncbi:hypothetical protein KAR28_03820 [Candidatus Parcubacteria bacterium]|nr:hypothetical protein [Candidatus Parcubacteria bacterium]